MKLLIIYNLVSLLSLVLGGSLYQTKVSADIINGVVPSTHQNIISVTSEQPLFRSSLETIIISEALQAGYSQSEADLFLRIARAESTMNERALGDASNNSVSYMGLFQIAYPLTWNYSGCVGDPYNATDNVRCAFKVQKSQGWKAWHVYTANVI